MTNHSKSSSPKLLNGRDLASFIKERQAIIVRSLKGQGIIPKLAIIRDNDDPVITKYVDLKKHYGTDIGVIVEDILATNLEELKSSIKKANFDSSTSAIIIQLPLKDPKITDQIVAEISPKKDVDGLSEHAKFDSATATAIHWLLIGHGIDLTKKKIAIVGRGRLVGAPLIKMWQASGYDVTVFGHDSDLKILPGYDVIVTATGKPHLITSDLVSPGTILVDAGTASEDGRLVGDLDDSVRSRQDILAITPKIGGVGPLTIAVLFDHVLRASSAK